MDGGNQMKKKIKVLKDELKVEKLLMEQKDEQLQATGHKASKAKDEARQAFRQTNEYNGVLLGWYFKGFELLRRYLLKHGLETNLEDLDFEVVDKEIEADEAAQAVQPSREEPSIADKVGEQAPPS